MRKRKDIAALQREVQELTDQNKQLTTEISLLNKELKAQTTTNVTVQHQQDKTAILWKGCARMPCGNVRPHVIVKGKVVYVGGGNTGKLEMTRTVYSYDTEVNVWSSLPITPYYTFSTLHIGGVTVISSLVTNTLFSFDEEKTERWCQRFPAMPTKRCSTSAVSTETYLVVVGGIAENK